jgi:hypothetical protein
MGNGIAWIDAKNLGLEFFYSDFERQGFIFLNRDKSDDDMVPAAFAEKLKEGGFVKGLDGYTAPNNKNISNFLDELCQYPGIHIKRVYYDGPVLTDQDSIDDMTTALSFKSSGGDDNSIKEPFLFFPIGTPKGNIYDYLNNRCEALPERPVAPNPEVFVLFEANDYTTLGGYSSPQKACFGIKEYLQKEFSKNLSVLEGYEMMNNNKFYIEKLVVDGRQTTKEEHLDLNTWYKEMDWGGEESCHNVFELQEDWTWDNKKIKETTFTNDEIKKYPEVQNTKRYQSLKEAAELWNELGDIPTDNEDCLERSFKDFPAGTEKEEIWAWFENEFHLSVAKDLMFSDSDQEITGPRM